MIRFRYPRPPVGCRLSRYDRASTGIAGPFSIEGTCLAPWLEAGDAVWVDRHLKPQEGDLVECVMRMVYRPRNPFAGGQRTREHDAIKLYRVRDGVARLTCSDGAYRADAHTILGVVVGAARRPRRWFRMGRPPLASIGRDYPEIAPESSSADVPSMIFQTLRAQR